LAALVIGDTALAALGITATSALAVCTVKSTSVNHTTYTSATSVGASETITLASLVTETNTATGAPTETLTVSDSSGSETFTEVQPVGGSGAIVPTANFVLDEAYTGATNFWRGQPALVDYATLASIIAAGLPIT
jgi:hypothetical protein